MWINAALCYPGCLYDVKSFVGALNSSDLSIQQTKVMFYNKTMQRNLVVIKAHIKINYTSKKAKNIWQIHKCFGCH
jgi:hypothetical protein